MAERKTDVTTFSKTFQEKQKTFPCDPQDLFQIALLYIDFQTNASRYKEDLFSDSFIDICYFDSTLSYNRFWHIFQFSKIKILPQDSGKLTYNLFGVIFQ